MTSGIRCFGSPNNILVKSSKKEHFSNLKNLFLHSKIPWMLKDFKFKEPLFDFMLKTRTNMRKRKCIHLKKKNQRCFS